jgi:hypothetical protein
MSDEQLDFISPRGLKVRVKADEALSGMVMLVRLRSCFGMIGY